MKNKLIFLMLMTGSFLTGVSFAGDVQQEKPARLTIEENKNIVTIKVEPIKDYKWNDKYPALIKFSVCNAVECLMLEEKLQLKNTPTL